ncbi:MAG: M14 family metallopeptidase [Bacteroidota bacterium]
MNRTIFFIIVGLPIIIFSQNRQNLLTTAERSNFESTATYKDVDDFIYQLKKQFDNVKVETIAESVEGRKIPLVILADPMFNSSNGLLNDDRTKIYIQGNIHAGEVEGKESSLMFARDILIDRKEILKDVVLIICPIFNADGNEKISPINRPYQNGPKNGVGLRYNGKNLDLNRDAMKVETPEVKGLLENVLNKYDPEILVDIHTTNGSYREEPVSFTWMMNPAGDTTLIAYMRDKMMPAVSKTLKEKYNTFNVFYGEFVDQRDPSNGWISYAYEPRYITNYIGLRNRLAILNENYVYSDFKARVWGSYNLLWSIIDYAVKNKRQIKELLKEADAQTISRGLNPTEKDSFALDSQVRPTNSPITINTYELETKIDEKGRERLVKTDNKKIVTVPYLADYLPTRKTRIPFAYLLTNKDPDVVTLLKSHGIKIEELTKQTELTVETYKIDNLRPEERLNQGHYNNEISGEFVTEKKTFAAGTLVIRTAQPLANVAMFLLEPESDDGLLHWNYFDNYLVPQWGNGYLPYPVYKLLNNISIETKNKYSTN